MPTATAPAPALPVVPEKGEPTKPTLDSPSGEGRPPADFMADFIGDFEAMSAGKPLPVRERDDKGKFKPIEKPAEKQAEKPKAKAPEKPAETAEQKPAEKTEETTEQPEKPPTRMRELGQRYDDLKKRVETEFKPTIQKLEAKVKEYETRKPEESTALLERVKSLEQEKEQLEKRIQYVDYAQSDHFKKTYVQPFDEAWSEAVAEFKELAIKEPAGENEMGEMQFKSRPATESDLIKLSSLPLSEMDETATKLFGASAMRAINHIQNLRKLASSRNKALAEAQQRSGEMRSRQQAEFKARNDSLANTWLETTKNLEERLPKAFKPDEGDADDKEAHTRGFALADLAFIGPDGLTEEQVNSLPESFREAARTKKLSDTQRVQLHALARLKTANHDRLLVKLRKAQAENAELKKSLADYEKSEPDASKAGESSERTVSKAWDEQIADEIRALDK